MAEEITNFDTAMSTKSDGEKCIADESGGQYALTKQGRIVVRHEPNGPYPIVIPCPGVKLIVNGRECTQPTPVSREDTVQLDIADERKEGNWSITVSSDGLTAILKISPTKVIHRILPDLPAANKLQIMVTEREERFPSLTQNELLQELSRLGIKYGVDWEACSRAADSCAEEELVIASGNPAEPGEDETIELMFTAESAVPVQVDGDKQVDYRERYVFTAVETGEILAVKHPSSAGRPGTSVKGELIVPAAPRDLLLTAGEGAMLSGDGKRVVAVRAGRPFASRSNYLVRVSVLPEIIHNGDVNLSSGNIDFKGDVKINGNVEMGMVVKADGNVTVEGYVSQATIQAAGSVMIKGNIMSSLVTAGTTADYLQEIISLIRSLSIDLHAITMAFQQLLNYRGLNQSNSTRDIGVVMKFLLDGKFRSMPTMAEAFKKKAAALPPGLTSMELNDFIQDLERMIINTPLTIDLQEVGDLARRASEWEQFFACPPSSVSDVWAKGILNSAIAATGDVNVMGGGCYNTQIQAGRKVTITGVFRGGEIVANGDVVLDEIGSKGGAVTRAVTGMASEIMVKQAYDNASAVVGGRVYHFSGDEKSVRLRLNKDGNLVLL